MPTKMTTSAQEALQSAHSKSIRAENSELHPEHLLHALILPENEQASIVCNTLQLAGVNLQALRTRLTDSIRKISKVMGGHGQVYPSPLFSRLLVLAEDEAKALHDEYVSCEHFVL